MEIYYKFIDGVLLLRFVDLYAGGITARDLCTQLFINYCNLEGQMIALPGSNTTKSTSPGIEEGFLPYTSEKVLLISFFFTAN